MPLKYIIIPMPIDTETISIYKALQIKQEARERREKALADGTIDAE